MTGHEFAEEVIKAFNKIRTEHTSGIEARTDEFKYMYGVKTYYWLRDRSPPVKIEGELFGA